MTYADDYLLRTASFSATKVADAIDGVLSRASGGVTTGAANAYACAPSPAWTALDTFRPLCVAVHASNTGPSTLNVSGLGARNVTYMKQPLVGGELLAGGVALFVWDGGTWELLTHNGGWAAWTPTYSASGSMTFTGVTTNLAIYQRHGQRVVVRLQATGTTGGTSSFGVRFTLPVTAGGSSAATLGASFFDSGTAARPAGACELVSSTVAQVSKYDTSSWGLGSGRSIQVAGEYAT